MKSVRHSTSPQETGQAAEALAASVRGGDVIALYGELGAGKTTFVQAFAKALGVHRRVQSPTFILMQEYPLARKGALRLLAHADAYRGDAAQFKAIGFQEYLGRPDTVTLVEWAERIEPLLPPAAIVVRLQHEGGDKRKIVIER